MGFSYILKDCRQGPTLYLVEDYHDALLHTPRIALSAWLTGKSNIESSGRMEAK